MARPQWPQYIWNTYGRLPALQPSRFLIRDSSSSKRSGEEKMLDILMLILGVGMFFLLLGYVAICDKI